MQVKKYNWIDGILAFLTFIIFFSFLLIYYKHITHGSGLSEQLRIKQALIPIAFGILLILFMLDIRRQKLQSIGITKYILKPSIIYSLVLIAIFTILLISYSLVYLGELKFHIKYSLYSYFIFELLQAGLIEELVFRGYISPRMRGVSRIDGYQ